MTVETSSLARISAILLAAGLAAGLAGCAAAGTSEGPDSPESSPSTGYDPHDQDTNNGGVSNEQAGAIATDEYGGTITSVEDDDFKGEPAWEVALEGADDGRIAVMVSKVTGQILHVDND